MSARGIGGLIVGMLMVLAAIYLFNRFSGRNVATLGAPAPKA